MCSLKSGVSILSAFWLLNVDSICAADLTTVITALPTSRCVTFADSAYCGPVDPVKLEGFRMTILKDGSVQGRAKYYWVIAGEVREVLYSRSGFWDTFMDERGGGMIVVERTAEWVKSLPKLSRLHGQPNPQARYMEITRLHLSTKSYFGHADVYDP